MRIGVTDGGEVQIITTIGQVETLVETLSWKGALNVGLTLLHATQTAHAQLGGDVDEYREQMRATVALINAKAEAAAEEATP